MKFEQKVLQFIDKFHMLKDEAGIIIGLSGGADSIALLEILCGLRQSKKLRLAAVHVHHGIRQEAQDDVDYCRQICFEKNIDFYVEYVNVPEYARQKGMSMEEAGRVCRYQLFENYRQELGMDNIAVAHHQNDQAETVLFQLFRGSGIRGLSGMAPEKGVIIRPLLSVTREEIEAFLLEKKLAYITDVTNESNDYSRNKIRHDILPVAEELCNGAAVRMSQTAAQLREVLDYMQLQTEMFLEKHSARTENTLQIELPAFSQAHPALQKMIIMEAIERVFQSRKDITEKHVESILDVLSKDGEKSVHLPKDGQVIKDYQTITFQYRKKKEPAEKFTKIYIEPDNTYFLDNGVILETKVFSGNYLENIPKNDCIKWFDYDKIKSTLFLRTREQGDYLTVKDDGSRKSLQDYMINEKIPKSERDNFLVLADGHHILWVIGKRISAYYKVTEQTKNILQVHIGGKSNG